MKFKFHCFIKGLWHNISDISLSDIFLKLPISVSQGVSAVPFLFSQTIGALSRIITREISPTIQLVPIFWTKWFWDIPSPSWLWFRIPKPWCILFWNCGIIVGRPLYSEAWRELLFDSRQESNCRAKLFPVH